MNIVFNGRSHREILCPLLTGQLRLGAGQLFGDHVSAGWSIFKLAETGERYVHEPLRLTVLIEAPVDPMTEVIARHESLRQLVDNGWVHLFALDDSGKPGRAYAGNLRWRSLS
jgi:uncharacterized protein YbcC (UPF0753/DUF2309 family)